MSQNENNGFVNHSLRMADSANMNDEYEYDNDEYDNDNNDFDQPENLDTLQTYIMPEVTTNPQGGQQPQGNQQNEVLPNRDLGEADQYMNLITNPPFEIAEKIDVFEGDVLKFAGNVQYVKSKFNSFLGKCDNDTITDVDYKLRDMMTQQQALYADITIGAVIKSLNAEEIYAAINIMGQIREYLYIPCMTYLTSGNEQIYKTGTYKKFVNYIVSLMQQYYAIYKPVGDSNFAFWWYAFCYPIVIQIMANDMVVRLSIQTQGVSGATRQDQPSPNGGANTQHPQQVGNTSHEMGYNPVPTV